MAIDPGNGGGLDIAAQAQARAAQRQAAGGASAQGPTLFIPLWKVRPAGPKAGKRQQGTNRGLFGDDNRQALGGTSYLSRTPATYSSAPAGKAPQFYSADQAASSFLDMDEKDRQEFMQKAIETGLIKPGSDGVSPADLFEAWQRATGYAANYNRDRSQDKWISPWEAATRMGVSGVAGSGGAYDPFKPRTKVDITKKDFTKGADAEQVTRTLESIFQQEMGRAPTEQERAVYAKAIQRQYDQNPERTTTTTQTDANGLTTGTSTATGGVDMTATLLDQVRQDPEAQSFQAGSTFFQAAMQALGAIA